MNERYLIDTKVMLPISPPGFASPKGRIFYTEEQVQQLIFDAFGSIFPKIILDGKTTYYELPDQKKRGDLIYNSRPVKEAGEIPRSEVMKLLEGWIRIRRKAQEPTLTKEVRYLLMNLKVPDPSKAIDSYRLSTQAGATSLHILWGYEDPTKRSISLEDALAKLLEVPADQLISLMSSSLKPNMNTTAQIPTYTTVQQLAGSAENHKKNGKTPLLMAIFGAVLATSMAALAISLNSMDRNEKSSGNAPHVTSGHSDSDVKPTEAPAAGMARREQGPENSREQPSPIADGPEDRSASSSLMDRIAPSAGNPEAKSGLLDSMIDTTAGSENRRESAEPKKESSLLDQIK